MVFMLWILASSSLGASGVSLLDHHFTWVSGQHIRETDDFAMSTDFVIPTSDIQFEVTKLEVSCSMRDLATTGAAVWDIGAMVSDRTATWSKPPPTDVEKDAMNYRGVAFGQVGPGWTGQPTFSLDYPTKTSNVAGAPVYNQNWIRFYGNSFASPDGRVHVSIVVWTGLGLTDLEIDSCDVHIVLNSSGGTPTKSTQTSAQTHRSTATEETIYPTSAVIVGTFMTFRSESVGPDYSFPAIGAIIVAGSIATYLGLKRSLRKRGHR
jgi:hypothetical protein